MTKLEKLESLTFWLFAVIAPLVNTILLFNGIDIVFTIAAAQIVAFGLYTLLSTILYPR